MPNRGYAPAASEAAGPVEVYWDAMKKERTEEPAAHSRIFGTSRARIPRPRLDCSRQHALATLFSSV
jgi:hypothetical protein